MTEGIEAITRASLSLALDAATLRQQVIANNIANINTEGYVPQRVNFAEYVREARQQLQDTGRLDDATVRAWAEKTPTPEPLLASPGVPASVHLDTQVAEMAQNAVHYQALLKGISRHMGILATAVGDGKR